MSGVGSSIKNLSVWVYNIPLTVYNACVQVVSLTSYFHLSDMIVAHQPNLMFIHFDSIDDAGHSHGWGSPEYYNTVKVGLLVTYNFIRALR